MEEGTLGWGSGMVTGFVICSFYVADIRERLEIQGDRLDGADIACVQML